MDEQERLMREYKEGLAADRARKMGVSKSSGVSKKSKKERKDKERKKKRRKSSKKESSKKVNDALFYIQALYLL